MFFKDIEDYKKYVPVNASFRLEQMAIYLRDVDQKVFKEYFGKDFLAELQQVFNDVNDFEQLEDPFKELIGYMRSCSANMALAKWLPIGQVNISQAGITINSNAEQKTAFAWQIDNVEDSVNEVAVNALESCLSFLDENIENEEFATYKESDEFKENRYLFVSSAREFCKYFSLMDNSRINFYKLRSTIRKVEDFDIKSIILPSVFEDLKTKLQSGDEIEEADQKLLDRIKPALVNLTVAKAITELSVNINPQGLVVFDNTANTSFTKGRKPADDNALARMATAALNDGSAYLKQLADFMEENKGDYPKFTEDPKYIAPEDEVDINDGSKPFFTGL